jgi:hypothetical protein
MGLCIASFKWRPDDFWNATPHEVMAAYEMYVEMNTLEE